jgi:DNA-binding transcriptional MocR family regulator
VSTIKTTVEKAYSILLSAIMENRLPRGEFLSQRKLADMTGASIISVREALKKLEHEGIVESIPRWQTGSTGTGDSWTGYSEGTSGPRSGQCMSTSGTDSTTISSQSKGRNNKRSRSKK